MKWRNAFVSDRRFESNRPPRPGFAMRHGQYHECLSLFAWKESLQRFHVTMLTQHRGPQTARWHLAFDPVPDQPVMYIEIREFIKQLPRE